METVISLEPLEKRITLASGREPDWDGEPQELE